MAEAPKVLVLGSYAPSLVGFRGSLISRMAAQGCRVVAAGGDFDPALEAKVRALGAEPRVLDVERASVNPFSNVDYGRRVAALLDETRPHCILSYTAKPVIWGSLAASKRRVPRVASMITGLGAAFTEGPGLKRRVARVAQTALYRRALRQCDPVFFQNPDDRALFEQLGLVRGDVAITLNGSGVDTRHYSVAELPATPVFFMAARLAEAKGVREYCHAALQVKAAHPQARFLLAGWLDKTLDAVSQSELDGWIAGGIEFLGRLEDIRLGMRQCSVFVLPSYREGTPRSVLEAMSMGRAVITTDTPGCRETVKHEVNGLLVPPRDAGAVVAAMTRFIETPEAAARMGAESRRYACDRFDVDAVNDTILEALRL